MEGFNWVQTAQNFSDFGGQEKVLHIPKTGLPFFDVLRLYGTIELFIGLQQEVYIQDVGNKWEVKARVREHLLKDIRVAAETLKKKPLTKNDDKWIEQLKVAIQGEEEYPILPTRNVSYPLDNPDSALKDGVRDDAARSYKGIESGYGEKSKVAFADALLAYAGQERTETVARVYFLPVFEGRVDFTKVVSPLRAWLGVPNILCAQALTLLALKCSLFAEGYAQSLSAVAYNTNLDGRKYYNYSGIILIESTALAESRKVDAEFVGHFYRTFRGIVGRAWIKGKAQPDVEDAMAHAYWLLQPSRKHLSPLITSIERQKRNGKACVIYNVKRKKGYAKEVFEMSYGKWSGDHEAVRKFARAVASAIYQARMGKESEDKAKRKVWYDEVVMLRSAPTAKAFIERAMILLEQGKRENQFIASVGNNEDFDPSSLFASIGNSRAEFETFRDLFRMYLVQESTPKSKSVAIADSNDGTVLNDNETQEEEKE
jgi:hypothetical protein